MAFPARIGNGNVLVVVHVYEAGIANKRNKVAPHLGSKSETLLTWAWLNSPLGCCFALPKFKVAKALNGPRCNMFYWRCSIETDLERVHVAFILSVLKWAQMLTLGMDHAHASDGSLGASQTKPARDSS